MATQSTPQATKAEAIRMVESGTPQAEVARTLGVNRATVHKWVQRAKGGRAPVPTAPGSPDARPPASDEVTFLRGRVRELESLLRERDREAACLREAVGYVARGVAR